MSKKIHNSDIDCFLNGTNIIRIEDYIKSNISIKFKCIKCNHIWTAKPNNILRGCGCPRCSGQYKNSKTIDEDLLTQNKAIKRISEYINHKTKIKFQCLKCNHIWNSLVSNILINNHGCPKCSKNCKLNNEEIDLKLKNRNIIRIGNYKNAQIPLVFKCLKCNIEWSTVIGNITNKNSGCPKCINKISKPETEWLLNLNVPNDANHRQVKLKINGKLFKVDGYISKTKTVYEFNGDFYHGNPDVYEQDKINPITGLTFGEMYRKTIEKENLLKQAGYIVISIWESEWNKK